MRRSEIIDGANQILKAINRSNIIKCLSALFRSREKSPEVVKDVMRAIKIYFVETQNFNSSAKQFASIFELEHLETPIFWVALTSSDGPSMEVREIHSNLRFARDYIPKIIKLLKREHIIFSQDNSEPIISNGKEMKTLSVTIFESGNIFSSPQRLVNVLESVDTFYNACAFMNNESPDTLSVIACDSGSDKSFDFLGVAKVIECVTQLIENLWDRVVFYREKQLDVRLDLINKSLPIYEKINELEQGKKIERELAERLRRNISDGVNKFIEAGASIPEIDVRSTYSSRSLLSPVQKLLVSAPEETSETKDSDSKIFNSHDNEFLENQTQFDSLNSSNLKPEEMDQLRQLLDKMQTTNSTVNQSESIDESFGEDEV